MVIILKQFKITKPIRLIELFGGIGSQAMALRDLNANFEQYRVVEFDKYAIASYNAIHNTNFEPTDITKVHGKDLNIIDTDKYCYMMTYSFPCGLQGTKIATEAGYKSIENVSVGDKVLTHNNRFCKVNKKMDRVSNHFYVLKGLGVPRLFLTGEHPLYVLRDGKPQWVKVKSLKCTDCFSFNVNQWSTDVPFSKEYMWLLGRYVADGFINNYLHNSVLFAISNKKEAEFLNNIPWEYKEKFRKTQKSCWEYRIADKDFHKICEQFGNGALHKRIPQWVINLPKDKLQSFFDGYISGAGHSRVRAGNKQIMFSTVSEDLFLGMQSIIAKLYNVICSCSIRHDTRKETFNDTYNCQFTISKNHKQQQKIEDKIYTAIKDITKIDKEVHVYNFEVDIDNSYTCQNVIVHNCQDLSIAGEQRGMTAGSGTRSSLLYEVQRLLDESNELPQVLVMENVPQIHSRKNINDFQKWLNYLMHMGYTTYYADLNAKDYGIPQSRNRCIAISILNKDSTLPPLSTSNRMSKLLQSSEALQFRFPKSIPLTTTMEDYLDTTVADKFYLTSDKAKSLIDQIVKTNKFISYIRHIKNNNDLSQNDTSVGTSTEIKIIGCMDNSIDHTFECANRVYDASGLSPTISTCGGGGIQPKILEVMPFRMVRTEQGKLLRRAYESHEIHHGFNEYRMPQIKDNGIANTITTVSKDNMCIEITDTYVIPDVFEPFVYNIDGISYLVRIRKFTPMECWRLMGFSDSDYAKAAQVNSDSQLYKQAGNSIVKQVLIHLFSQML